MIIKPKKRGFICTTAHPVGCAAHVQEQIDYVTSSGPLSHGPKKVLIIGASTGYGLSSRILTAFGYNAATIGVIFEKAAEGKRTATAGWYNTAAVEEKAHAKGLYAKSINGDAFSDEVKSQVIDLIKNDLTQVDLIVYSLASPRRQHPKTGQVSKSVLKPIKTTFTSKTLNLEKNELEDVVLNEATQDEINQTVAVMGGEDWEYWIDALEKENLLAPGCVSVAYTYVGPEITKIVYRQGTIGAAKDHLEATAKKLDERLKKNGGRAFVSANKALVTQSSSAIPVIPLYFVVLKKIMMAKNLEENCIEQIYRMFTGALYKEGEVPVDENGMIRVDDRELNEDVQAEVMAVWKDLSDENLRSVSDIEGYQVDFLKLFGFGLPGVDYEADVEPNKPIPSIK